jgi:hypothetical protein
VEYQEGGATDGLDAPPPPVLILAVDHTLIAEHLTHIKEVIIEVRHLLDDLQNSSMFLAFRWCS